MAIIRDGSRNVELTGKDKEEYIKQRFPKYYKDVYIEEEDQIITSREQELTMRIAWLEKGLKEIYFYCNGNKEMKYVNFRVYNHFSEIENKVKSILNSELITADSYNEE